MEKKLEPGDVVLLHREDWKYFFRILGSDILLDYDMLGVIQRRAFGDTYFVQTSHPITGRTIPGLGFIFHKNFLHLISKGDFANE